jgi:hypothetical protein
MSVENLFDSESDDFGPGPTSDPNKGEPLKSWRLMSNRSTLIEFTVWSKMIQGPTGPVESLTVSAQRSYKDQDGHWHKGGRWRVHDIPVLLVLLAKAQMFTAQRDADAPSQEDSR